MTAKILRRPYEYATAGNYPAGGNAWNGQPRIYSPTDTELVNGATPNTPIPAEWLNYLNQVEADSITVQNHAALTKWSHHKQALGNAADTFGQFLLPMSPSNISQGTQLSWIATLGLINSNSHANLGISPDGASPASFSDTGLGQFTAASADRSGRLFGCVGTAGNFYQAGGWSTFTPALGGNADVAFFTPGGAYLIGQLSTGVKRATALGGTWTTVLTVATTAPRGIVAGNGIIVLLTRQSGTLGNVKSTDDGLTWASGGSLGGATADGSITFNASAGLFVVVDSVGATRVSADAVAWTLVKTVTGGILGSIAKSLVSCGAAIVQLFELNSAPFWARGVAYSFDLGATWYQSQFGDSLNAAPAFLSILAANDRVYVADAANLYISGQLSSPNIFFSGV